MQLGIMTDWDVTYMTLGDSTFHVHFILYITAIDHEYEIRQLRTFQRMVENGPSCLPLPNDSFTISHL